MDCIDSTWPDVVLRVQVCRRAQPYGIVNQICAGNLSEHESCAQKSALVPAEVRDNR
jgi:hypothetical protein